MTFRIWTYVLVFAVISATAALVIANVYSFSGSELVLLLLNTMWIVGLAGTVASLVAIFVLNYRRHRRPRA
ncbi:hypothetical protein [Rathayibacter oskolensis]|nr:hypothetical protein [Rathayibacter oskolensis]